MAIKLVTRYDYVIKWYPLINRQHVPPSCRFTLKMYNGCIQVFCLAMSELISHCYKNYLDKCEEKWVWKLWGCHCHCPNFHGHYNQRYKNVYPHRTHTKYRPLAEHSYSKSWLQLKEKRESEWVVSLLLSYGSKNRGSGQVFVCNLRSKHPATSCR